MISEPLRRPFIICLSGIRRRVVAIERHDAGLTFLVTDQGGAINHAFFMQLLRAGAATFRVEEEIEIVAEFSPQL